jgi:hypothetical protein
MRLTTSSADRERLFGEIPNHVILYLVRESDIGIEAIVKPEGLTEFSVKFQQPNNHNSYVMFTWHVVKPTGIPEHPWLNCQYKPVKKGVRLV